MCHIESWNVRIENKKEAHNFKEELNNKVDEYTAESDNRNKKKSGEQAKRLRYLIGRIPQADELRKASSRGQRVTKWNEN